MRELKPVLTAFRCVRSKYVRPTWTDLWDALDRELSTWRVHDGLKRLARHQALRLYREAYGSASTPEEE